MNYIKYDENKSRKCFSDFSLSKRLKFATGRILVRIFPGKAERIARTPFLKSSTKLDHLFRNGLYAEAFLAKDHRKLRAFLSHYWENEASDFTTDWQDRFDRMFLQHDVAVVDELEKFIADSSDPSVFSQLYEIGCGGGQVLRYIADRLECVELFEGIDLGSEQIAENNRNSDNESISYHTADATEWIPANALPQSIFMTNGGVFEYILREELQTLFSHIGERLKPAAIAIVETVAVDHDLDNEPESFVYGRELAFSHNYPALLRDAGFSIRYQSERGGESIDGGGRWLRLLAVKS